MVKEPKMANPIRRLWLHNIGVFEIIPNSGKGSCLFQAISQALTFSTRSHHKIRQSTVDHMTCRKWSRRLDEFPEFWKHKIVRLWLKQERSHFAQQDMERKRKGNKLSENILSDVHRKIKCKFCKCRRCFQGLIERSRHNKYFRIKRLLQKDNCNTYSYLKRFKYIFHQFMSQLNEPGTRFELEAAAHRFRFHFDYLQMIPFPKNSNAPSGTTLFKDLKLTPSDILNLNNNTKPKLLPAYDKNLFSFENLNESIEPLTSTELPTIKMATYQFHSCRNNCKLARGLAPEPYDHYFFLHSPITSFDKYGSTWERFGLSSASGLASHDCGHWELLLPIFVQKYPVPLNQRIFGLNYEITDANRKFMTRNGQRREVLDSVAKAIDSYVTKNPSIIPPEDPLWPKDHTDDYIGCCAAPLTRDSLHQCKCESTTDKNSKTLSKPARRATKKAIIPGTRECCWWHSTTRNIDGREDLKSNDDEDVEGATKLQSSNQTYRLNEIKFHGQSKPFGRSTFFRRILLRHMLARRKCSRMQHPKEDEEDLTSSINA